MKKMMILAMILVMLVTAASALAEDSSALPDEGITVAQPVEKLSDYTARALPITEETYNEVVNNVLDQIGVTYFVKGTVAEIRDDFLPRVLICAGEDGESLPVYIEVPATSSYLPQPGDNLRVYGEVVQLLNGKPLLNGRYIFQEEEEAEPAPAVGTDPETGLTVENPRLAGVKQFPIENGRYVVLLFKATRWRGELVSSEEGQMEWVEYGKLSAVNTVDDLKDLLRVINSPELTEFQYTVSGDDWNVSIR